jgi:hypothetical protein
MPVKVLPDGSFIADTVREALALQAEILKKGRGRVPSPPPADGAPTVAAVDVWADFSQRLSGPPHTKQRKALTLIKGRSPKTVSIEELTKDLGCKNGSGAGGVIGSIGRLAKSLGIDSQQIIVSVSTGVYRAGPLLMNSQPPTS